jgi:hypothetical protein
MKVPTVYYHTVRTFAMRPGRQRKKVIQGFTSAGFLKQIKGRGSIAPCILNMGLDGFQSARVHAPATSQPITNGQANTRDDLNAVMERGPVSLLAIEFKPPGRPNHYSD